MCKRAVSGGDGTGRTASVAAGGGSSRCALSLLVIGWLGPFEVLRMKKLFLGDVFVHFMRLDLYCPRKIHSMTVDCEPHGNKAGSRGRRVGSPRGDASRGWPPCRTSPEGEMVGQEP